MVPLGPPTRRGHKRVETAGVYPLVRPRGVSALPAEVQRKTPRPSGTNTPAAVRVPRWVGTEKECRPDRANTLTQFVHPGQPVLKKLPPRSGEPPARFKVSSKGRPQLVLRSGEPQVPHSLPCPAEVQRKTSRPLGANTPTAVRVPRSAGAEKAAAPFGRTACAVRVSRLTLRSYLTILRKQSMLSQQQNRRKYEPVHPCTLRSVPRH